jgi:hydroxyacylglutathione hydrolase
MVQTAQVGVIQVGPLGTNCYVIYSEGSTDCVVVDPGGEPAKIIGILDEKKLSPTVIVATHAHADHTGGIAALVERYGSEFAIGAEDALYATEQSSELIEMLGDFQDPPTPSRLLNGGDSISLADSEIAVLANPGHTQGSTSLHIDGHVLTGDTLFRESIGRFDLPGGNEQQEISSIKNVLLTLPDETIVLPGHGPSSTIGHEKTANPFLR